MNIGHLKRIKKSEKHGKFKEYFIAFLKKKYIFILIKWFEISEISFFHFFNFKKIYIFQFSKINFIIYFCWTDKLLDIIINTSNDIEKTEENLKELFKQNNINEDAIKDFRLCKASKYPAFTKSQFNEWKNVWPMIFKDHDSQQ